MRIDPKFWPIWFGCDGVPEEQVVYVFRVLQGQLQRRFGSNLQPTPGTTGILAWRRLQGSRQGVAGGIWPTLPVDLQQIIRETTGQGRFECCPVPTRASELPNVGCLGVCDGGTPSGNYLETIPDLYCLDMTFAYAACATALQSGKEWRYEERPAGGWGYRIEAGDHNARYPGFLVYTPAWYRVRFEAPKGWGQVGILPYRGHEGWEWPSIPGNPYDTWASHQEVRLAIESGWQVEILGRIYAVCPQELKSFPRPLELWAKRLTEMRCEEFSRPVEAALYRTAVRNILLHGIGHFGRGPSTVTRTAREEDTVPDHELARETVRPVEQGWAYEDYAPFSGDAYLHPEWAALIWADCRTRLLRSWQFTGEEKVAVGALSLPREQIVGFALDCIYATHDPGWPDGAKGGYRIKKSVRGPLPAPRNMADIYRLVGETL